MSKPQPRTQIDRREATRQALLDAAVDCLLLQGYQKSTMASIARAANVTTGAVQHHFASKKELMQAVISERLFAPHRIEAPATQGQSLDRRCRQLVDIYWQYYSNPRYVAIWDIILAARHDEELMIIIKAWQSRSVKGLEAFIGEQFPELQMSKNKLKQAQYFLTSQLRGLSLLAAVDDQRPNIEKQLALLADALLGCMKN